MALACSLMRAKARTQSDLDRWFLVRVPPSFKPRTGGCIAAPAEAWVVWQSSHAVTVVEIFLSSRCRQRTSSPGTHVSSGRTEGHRVDLRLYPARAKSFTLLIKKPHVNCSTIVSISLLVPVRPCSSRHPRPSWSLQDRLIQMLTSGGSPRCPAPRASNALCGPVLSCPVLSCLVLSCLVLSCLCLTTGTTWLHMQGKLHQSTRCNCGYTRHLGGPTMPSTTSTSSPNKGSKAKNSESHLCWWNAVSTSTPVNHIDAPDSAKTQQKSVLNESGGLRGTEMLIASHAVRNPAQRSVFLPTLLRFHALAFLDTP